MFKPKWNWLEKGIGTNDTVRLPVFQKETCAAVCHFSQASMQIISVTIITGICFETVTYSLSFYSVGIYFVSFIENNCQVLSLWWNMMKGTTLVDAVQ